MGMEGRGARLPVQYNDNSKSSRCKLFEPRKKMSLCLIEATSVDSLSGCHDTLPGAPCGFDSQAAELALYSGCSHAVWWAESKMTYLGLPSGLWGRRFCSVTDK